MRFDSYIRYKFMPDRIITAISQTKGGMYFLSIIGFIYPIAAGIVVGETTVNFSEWKHPAFVYVLAGLLTQVFITLLKNWFSERRDLLAHAERMREQQAKHYEDIISSEREARKSIEEQLRVANESIIKTRILEEVRAKDALP